MKAFLLEMPVFTHIIQPTLLWSNVYNAHFLLISFIILFAVSKNRTQFFGSKAAYEQMKIISTKVSAKPDCSKNLDAL